MIELKNISFTYENSREGDSQLRHVDLQVGRGELVILAGRSGCGKTTLTRVLNGLCPQFYPDRKSTRLNSSHASKSRMPSSA